MLELQQKGLSASEVEKRIEEGRVNTPVSSSSKTVKKIILENVFTYFNFIFLFLAAILIAVGSYKELTFLFVILANTAIGIVQELLSKRKLDQLTLLAEAQAQVMREGELVTIPVDELVEDDLVYYKAGCQIAADGKVILGEVQVNEALVTGEADEIIKKEGDELLSGSFIISGECYEKLTRVGEKSYGASLTKEAKKAVKRTKPGMMKALTQLLYVIGVVIVPVGILLYMRQTRLLQLSVKEGVESTAAAIIGMIPEGLYLLTNVALAVSVGRLAQKRILVQDLKCTETLARVSMLCVDKTGTITEGRMQMTGLLALNGEEEAIRGYLKSFAENMPGDNETIKAIQEYFHSGETKKRREGIQIQGFSSKTKYSAMTLENGETFYLGAPDILRPDMEEALAEKIREHTRKGERVLLFKRQEELLALLILKNPVRPSARETFSYFKENQVEVKVISGDDPETVAAVAMEAGIEGADNYINAAQLKSERAIREAVRKYTVFGRVKPEQKRQIVKALQKAGHTVAMTGDGVNDVLALKSADCSIAMAQGSEAAAQVADLLLIDSDFSAMPQVVAEGRRVINNIERTAALYLVKNIFSFFLAIISIIAVFEYPLVPSQLTLLSMVTIGLPSFVLALEPNKDKVSGRFMRNVLKQAAPAAIADVLIILGVMLFKEAFHLESSQASTITTFLLIAVGFYMVWKVSGPKSIRQIALLSVMGILLAGILWFVPDMFSITRLNFGSILILAVFIMLIPSFMYILTKKRKNLFKN